MPGSEIGYTLSVTLLGMGVVFGFLVVLSVVMVLMKHLFPEGGRREVRDEQARADRNQAWLAVAVAACLADEDGDPNRATASPWQPKDSDGRDAWVTGGKVLKSWKAEHEQ